LALAVAIAVTEFVMYSPSIVQDDLDEDIFTKDSTLQDHSDNQGIDQESTDKDNKTPGNFSDEYQDLEQKDDSVTQGDESSQLDSANDQNLPFVVSNEHVIVIKSGDTLGSVLDHLGFSKNEIHLASSELSKIFNLRGLKIGQEIIVRGKRNDDGSLTLEELEMRPDYRFKVIVKKSGAGFTTKKVDIPIKSIVRNISGTLNPRSPDYSLQQCGMKGSIIRETLRVLRQVVNFRQVKNPIDFEFLCKYFYDDDGNSVSSPELLYVSVLFNGKIVRLYRFLDNGVREYVDANGMILSTIARPGSMLAQPLGSMKVTSGFGLRIHPISGRLKGHTGVDLSARIGTPVRAAASGVVDRASNYSGYGKFVHVRHSATISTAYAHLSRISVRRGQHVIQGQVIGYTGNTGYSYGPHLHYEVLKNGKPVNPLAFVKQEPHKLSGTKLVKFNKFRKDVSLQIVGLTSSSKKVANHSRKYS
jgi:murein DD-endopeptidase MepM/ murein hydrolase activator NlpD